MKAFVTGGGGFLGNAIVRLLLQKGAKVTSFSRGDYPMLAKMGVKHIQGNLGDLKALETAMADADCVYHVAAKAGIWGSHESFYEANVLGTQHVIAACLKLGIPKLVYTSTPSVIYHKKGIEGADESIPYPKTFEAAYPQTKAEAEQMVLAANQKDLATVALRPHLIWGPGDHHFLPRLMAKAHAGKLRIVGRSPNLVDSIYIDNAAHAHLLAMEHLAPDAPVAGKAYFLSQGEPLPIADLINQILVAVNAPPVKKHIPTWVAYLAGSICEYIYPLLNKPEEPPMTRFLARQLSTPHWFDIRAAQRDFGYTPQISLREGMQRLAFYYQDSVQINTPYHST